MEEKVKGYMAVCDRASQMSESGLEGKQHVAMTFNEWKQVVAEVEPLLRQLQQVCRNRQLSDHLSLIVNSDFLHLSYTDETVEEDYCSYAFDDSELYHSDHSKSPTGLASE